MTTVVDASGWKEGETVGMNLAYLYNAARFASSRRAPDRDHRRE
jgi:hypothetical protein